VSSSHLRKVLISGKVCSFICSFGCVKWNVDFMDGFVLNAACVCPSFVTFMISNNKIPKAIRIIGIKQEMLASFTTFLR
jgi:hypothetical protein